MSTKGSEEIKVKRGHLVINEGTPSDGIYLIKEGQFEITKKSNGAERIPLSVAQSGQFLGEMALLNNEVHTATVKALTDGVIIKIPKDVINAQLKTAPGWLVSLARGLAQRLKKTNNILKKNNIMDSSILDAILAIEQNESIKNPTKPKDEK